MPQTKKRNQAFVQYKLAIGQPGDKYEKEADSVADKVMKMNDHSAVQMQPVDEEEAVQPKIQMQPVVEEEEESVQPKIQMQAIEEEEPIQMQPNEEEEESLQMKSAIQKSPNGNQYATNDISQKLNSTKGSGEKLPNKIGAEMGRKIGADFSATKIHTDSQAVQMNRQLGAQAFTHGSDIFFNQGKYAPNSSGGKRLLAHELVHTVQQNNLKSRIQRKIIVAGKTYTPTTKYYKWLDDNSYSSMKEFIKRMHNGGNPPDYIFSSYSQMGREVKIRNQALKGMEEVNSNGSVNYGRPHRLDTTYWDKVGPTHFKVKSSLPSGKKPSDAIESIFKAGADNRLECNSLMVAVQYRAMLKGLGKDKFNTKFPNGQGIIISPHHQPPTGVTLHPIWDKKLFKKITISGESDLLPGDWVYFKNFGDYATWNPGGLWTGEHALYMGGGKFQGFGPNTFAGGTSMTKVALEQRLCDKYNTGADAAHQKTYTASTNVYSSSTFMVGLRNYARRPVIKEIDK